MIAFVKSPLQGCSIISIAHKKSDRISNKRQNGGQESKAASRETQADENARETQENKARFKKSHIRRYIGMAKNYN